MRGRARKPLAQAPGPGPPGRKPRRKQSWQKVRPKPPASVRSGRRQWPLRCLWGLSAVQLSDSFEREASRRPRAVACSGAQRPVAGAGSGVCPPSRESEVPSLGSPRAPLPASTPRRAFFAPPRRPSRFRLGSRGPSRGALGPSSGRCDGLPSVAQPTLPGVAWSTFPARGALCLAFLLQSLARPVLGVAAARKRASAPAKSGVSRLGARPGCQSGRGALRGKVLRLPVLRLPGRRLARSARLGSQERTPPASRCCRELPSKGL